MNKVYIFHTYRSKGKAKAPSPPQMYQACLTICRIRNTLNGRPHATTAEVTSMTMGATSNSVPSGDKVVDPVGVTIALVTDNWSSHKDRAVATVSHKLTGSTGTAIVTMQI
jgi:hypothetical protein